MVKPCFCKSNNAKGTLSRGVPFQRLTVFIEMPIKYNLRRIRRGDRVADCARLENECSEPTVGSNPTLSA
jgi:hypothetical protein